MKANNYEEISYFLISSIFLLSILVLSPLIGVASMGTGYALLTLLLITYLFIFKKRKINTRIIYFAALILLFSLFSAFYWESYYPVKNQFWLISSIILFGLATRKELSKFVDIASYFLFILLIGAIIGFISSYLGFGPYYDFPNPDGRSNYVFIGTFTNAFLGDFIRPAGIFDEPGAFSLIICLIVAMRHALSKSSTFSFLILIMGIITTSLAHIVFTIIFLVANLSMLIRFKGLFFGTFITGAIVFSILGSDISNKIYERLTFFIANVSQVLEKKPTQEMDLDNRTRHLMVSINAIKDPRFSVLNGFKDCHKSPDCLGKLEHICCEPLSPLVKGGFFFAFPYYLALFISIVALFTKGKNGLILFAIGALLLQRPALYGIGYSLLITISYGLLMFYKMEYSEISKN